MPGISWVFSKSNHNQRAVRVFVYELLTAGGWPSAAGPLPKSLLREGATMLASVVADFAAIDGVDVCTICDPRQCPLDLSGLARSWESPIPPPSRQRLQGRRAIPRITQSHLDRCQVDHVTGARQEQRAFRRLAAAADWTVVIAPELDGLLWQRARWVESTGGRLLGPSPELIALAAHKERAARLLAAAGIPAAEGRVLLAGQPLPAEFPYPAVIKPIDGAGSLDLQLVEGPDAVLRQPVATTRRLERYYHGTAASVAVLCGPAQNTALAACRQELSSDGQFAYLGGSVPLPAPLGPRAQRLARRATNALPRPLGYLGIDLVLGAASDGTEDVVIEVNPRLTTSYVGLRAATTTNLAAAMLTIAGGGRVAVSFRPALQHFTAAGVVETAQTTDPKRGATPRLRADDP